jgi:hypothetical protein
MDEHFATSLSNLKKGHKLTQIRWILTPLLHPVNMTMQRV